LGLQIGRVLCHKSGYSSFSPWAAMVVVTASGSLVPSDLVWRFEELASATPAAAVSDAASAAAAELKGRSSSMQPRMGFGGFMGEMPWRAGFSAEVGAPRVLLPE
jgi:hypothetical protein